MEIYERPIPGSVRRYKRYIRLGLNELPAFEGTRRSRRITIGSYTLNCRSTRMHLLFVHRELKCKCCGIEASFAAVESTPSSNGWKSLNFYAYDFEGKEVLMTWDHITPKSKGGSNALGNAQCLCILCNNMKGCNNHFRHIRAQRIETGLPVLYEYLDKGVIRYWWTGKVYSENI